MPTFLNQTPICCGIYGGTVDPLSCYWAAKLAVPPPPTHTQHEKKWISSEIILWNEEMKLHAYGVKSIQLYTETLMEIILRFTFQVISFKSWKDFFSLCHVWVYFFTFLVLVGDVFCTCYSSSVWRLPSIRPKWHGLSQKRGGKDHTARVKSMSSKVWGEEQCF